jgi:hypothetical protein
VSAEELVLGHHGGGGAYDADLAGEQAVPEERHLLLQRALRVGDAHQPPDHGACSGAGGRYGRQVGSSQGFIVVDGREVDQFIRRGLQAERLIALALVRADAEAGAP